MDKKPKASAKKSKAEETKGPYSKAFLRDQGPKINGSSLTYTSASSKTFRIPEARA